MEIAFATTEKNVYILRIPPQDYYWLTIRDVFCTRSRLRNKDRFYNSGRRRIRSSLKPVAEYKLHASDWLTELRSFISHTFPDEFQLRVRGRFQYHFFKNICGFKNVSRIWLKTGLDVVNCIHEHNCKFINYPCPGIEVGTMAKYHKLIDFFLNIYIT